MSRYVHYLHALLLSLLLCVLVQRSSAQYLSSRPSNHRVGTVTFLTQTSRIQEEPQFEVVGSPYDGDSLKTGTIFLTNDKMLNVKMRYNIYYDWMEYQKVDSIFAVSPDLIIKKIEIGGKTFIVDTLVLKKENVLSYFQLLESGKFTLLSKMHVTFRERQQGKPIEGDIPAKYSRQRDTFYYRAGKGRIREISNVQQIIDAFDGDKAALTQFAKTEKLGVRKSAEVIKLIRYCNSH